MYDDRKTLCVLDRLAGQRSLLVNPRHTRDQRHWIDPLCGFGLGPQPVACEPYQQAARKEQVPATVVALGGKNPRNSRTTGPPSTAHNIPWFEDP